MRDGLIEVRVSIVGGDNSDLIANVPALEAWEYAEEWVTKDFLIHTKDIGDFAREDVDLNPRIQYVTGNGNTYIEIRFTDDA